MNVGNIVPQPKPAVSIANATIVIDKYEATTPATSAPGCHHQPPAANAAGDNSID